MKQNSNLNKRKCWVIIIGLVLILLIIGLIVLLINDESDVDLVQEPNSATQEQINNSQINTTSDLDSMQATELDQINQPSHSSFINWSGEVEFAEYDSYDRWLFFHQKSCIKCVALEKDIIANLDNIPENTVIFQVDFDKELALREQYGVTIQTTIVSVDQAGALLKKYVAYDNNTLQALIDNLHSH